MKIKYKLLALAEMVIIVSCIGYAGISSATTCTANTSPTAACTDLVINANTSSIATNYPVTTGSSTNAVEVSNSVTVTQFTNSSSLVSTTGGLFDSGLYINSGSTITTLNNSGTIDGYSGLLNAGSIGALNNSGVIGTTTGSIYGLVNTGTINNLINTGTIISREYAVSNGNGATITTFTNTGSIIAGSGYYGITNNTSGTISTLNNAQNGLTYTGKLPTNYNVIISSNNYGTLTAVNSGTSTTNFGIYSAIPKFSTYTNVLQGLATARIGSSRTGTYQGLTWTLAAGTGANNWDLVFSGTNTAVMSALNQTTAALQNAFTLQNTVLVNGFTYDCPVFDKNNVCVSVGGRYTTVNTDSVNSTGGLLIGAYRMNNQVRMGAYIDQNVSTNSTGIVKVSNASPMVGVFGVWNERLDGAGTELKVSAGYGQKNTTMTRQVVDGTEAGSGSSTLTSQGVQAIGKYGFAVTDKTIVSPYAGLRYTQNNMGGYTEGSSATVTAPLSYSAVNTNATTVVAGLGANYKVVPAITLLASAGLENDLNTSNGNYTATGLYGLNSINFNSSPVRTRATASAGAYYDITKNQRLSLNYIFRQEQFQGVNTNAAFLTYAIGL